MDSSLDSHPIDAKEIFFIACICREGIQFLDSFWASWQKAAVGRVRYVRPKRLIFLFYHGRVRN